MNIENIYKVISFLKDLPDENFDLSVVYSERSCGSVACVYGYFPVIFPNNYYYDRWHNVINLGTGNGSFIIGIAKMLDISYDLARCIGEQCYYKNPTREAVIDRLEKVRDGRFTAESMG